MQRQQDQLQWMNPDIKRKILEHSHIKDYQNHHKNTTFIKVQKLFQENHHKFKRKQYLGYQVEPAPIHLLHPILHIFVRLQICEMELLHRITKGVDFFMRNPFQSVQKIYNYKQTWFEKDQYNALLITSQIYKFTLFDLFSILKEKNLRPLSNRFIQFVKAFLFRSYLSILYALDHAQASHLCLSFDFDPKNILIDQFFCLMLGNPIYGSQQIRPLLAYQNDKHQRYINGSILTQIYNLFNKTISFIQLREVSQIQKDISYRIFSRKVEYIKLKDQIGHIERVFEDNKNLRFQFPDSQICSFLREVQIELGNNQSVPLIKFQLEQVKRQKQKLLQRSLIV